MNFLRFLSFEVSCSSDGIQQQKSFDIKTPSQPTESSTHHDPTAPACQRLFRRRIHLRCYARHSRAPRAFCCTVQSLPPRCYNLQRFHSRDPSDTISWTPTSTLRQHLSAFIHTLGNSIHKTGLYLKLAKYMIFRTLR